VRRGFIDHSDSLGAAARFGRGDVQWLTAGKGIVHSEMFPLLDKTADNPVELFQIWLNLPASDKLVEPHFAMLWSDNIPVVRERSAEITIIAGALGEHVPPPPPPRSWASRADSNIAIWSIVLRGEWTLPPAKLGTTRTLYVFRGSVRIGDTEISKGTGVALQPDVSVDVAGDAEMLLLQGKPIGEPVAQHGPFVMNTRVEIQQAFVDYQRTKFGGWPWPSDDPVHPRDRGRFARHADGRVEDIG
jgi:hypothetical protein